MDVEGQSVAKTILTLAWRVLSCVRYRLFAPTSLPLLPSVQDWFCLGQDKPGKSVSAGEQEVDSSGLSFEQKVTKVKRNSLTRQSF